MMMVRASWVLHVPCYLPPTLKPDWTSYDDDNNYGNDNHDDDDDGHFNNDHDNTDDD